VKTIVPTIAILATALLLVCGCGNDPAVKQPLTAPPTRVNQMVLKELTVPQPLNARAELSGDDILLNWYDGCEGDYNLDGEINGRDVFSLTARLGKLTEYDPDNQAELRTDNCIDGNRDGEISGVDLIQIARHYNLSCRGFRIYHSLNGFPEIELTSEEISRTEGTGLCLPSFTYRAAGKARETGIHRFYITASSSYLESTPTEGTVVTVEVFDKATMRGFPADAPWPSIMHDRRNTLRSPFTGPRTFEWYSVDRFKFQNSTSPSIKLAPGGAELLFGYNRYWDSPLPFGVSSVWDFSGEFVWKGLDSGDIINVDALHCMEDGGLLAVVATGQETSELRLLDCDGVQTDVLSFPTERRIERNSTVLTPAQNLLSECVFHDPVEYRRLILWSIPENRKIWSRGMGEVSMGAGTSPVCLSSDLLVTGDSGYLLGISEEHGLEWEYALMSNPDDLNHAYYAVSVDAQDQIYFAFYNQPDYNTDRSGCYGILSADGEELFNSGPVPGRIDNFLPLDDGTAIVLINPAYGYSGTMTRLRIDTQEPLWTVELWDYDHLIGVDAERHIYISGHSSVLCWSPDGELVYGHPIPGSHGMIAQGGDLVIDLGVFDTTCRIPAHPRILND